MVKFIKNKMKNVLKIDPILALGIIIFSYFYAPIINSIPYLDGNIDFIKSYDFYRGGFTQYFQNWGSVHPPLKLFISYFLFKLFGLNVFSYNIIGLIFGTIGIIYIYKLCKNIFDKKTAMLSSLFLSTSSMFIAAGIFSLIDYLISVFILISVYFYSQKKYFIYGLVMSLSALIKETALLLPMTVITIEIFYFLKKRLKIKSFNSLILRIINLSLPFITYFLWSVFIRINGQTAWNDWNFSSTASKGSIFTIINNLLTLNFLNKYAFQNWEQLFILNFNWIFWIIFIFTFTFFIFRNLQKIKNNLRLGFQRTKTILILLIFPTLYTITVLSFQTYTIPRYALPVICILLIGVSWAIIKLINNVIFLYKILISSLLIVTVILQLFYSSDPVSLSLWGRTSILGENLYALNEHLDGNDGITYNIQYLSIVKKRSEAISTARNYVSSNQCNWIFPDPNNDYKTILILKLLNSDTTTPCLYKY